MIRSRESPHERNRLTSRKQRLSWSEDDIEMNVRTLEVLMLPGAAVVCVDV